MRFPDFRDKWQELQLGEIAEKINSGKTPLGGEAVYAKEGVLFIRSQNVNNDKLDLANSVYIPEEVNASMKNSVVYPNDILLNITGASLGRSCVVPKNFTTGNVNQHVCIIRLKKKYNPRFIQPILSSAKGQNILLSLQTGGGREGLNFENIKKITFCTPDLEEQNKIAHLLILIQERIETQNKIIEQLETSMQGLKEKLFTKKMKFKDEDGKDFPEWGENYGNSLFENISNKNHNSDLPILAITQEYGAIPRDLIDYNVSVTDKSVESYKVVQKGDYIISLRSFQGGIEFSNYEGICSPAYVVLRPIKEFDSTFFRLYFKTTEYIQRLTKNLEGIRDGKMISFKYFSEVIIPTPTIEEQSKIANFLLSIERKIETERRILAQYSSQKKFLLENMFM